MKQLNLLNIKTNAKDTPIEDTGNNFTATNVEDALVELKGGSGDLTTLQTTNKANLVGAVNELFQSANNGKTTIATAIGSPLLSSDTFSAMGTKINTLKNTLATNNTNKGVTSSGTESLQSLINKTGNIALGKKYATGTSNAISDSTSFTRVNGTTLSQAYVLISLSFTPSTIVVNGKFSGTSTPECTSIYSTWANGAWANPTVKNMLYTDADYNHVSCNFKVDSAINIGGGSYKIPVRSNSGTACTWIAYE